MPSANLPRRSSTSNAPQTSAGNPPDASSESDERPAPVSAWQRFWHRYSAHGEFPLSSMSSIGVHVLLLLLVMLMTQVLTKPESQQLGVDVIRVGDEPEAAAGEMAGKPGDAGLTATQSDGEAVPAQPDAPPTEQLQTEVSPDESPTVNLSPGEEVKNEAAVAAQSAAATVRRAQQSLAQAKSRLAKNMNAGSGGLGTGGSGDGRTGSTPGAGGTGTTGRAARQGRWILRVRPISIENLLAQYESLGAVIAFPLNGERYRFFSKLTRHPPVSEVKTLAGEGRMYWVEENVQQISGLAEVLNTAMPAYILVFLPHELETRMVKMEHDYGNLSEDQIASTTFAVVQRGGGYDIIVEEQKAR